MRSTLTLETSSELKKVACEIITPQQQTNSCSLYVHLRDVQCLRDAEALSPNLDGLPAAIELEATKFCSQKQELVVHLHEQVNGMNAHECVSGIPGGFKGMVQRFTVCGVAYIYSVTTVFNTTQRVTASV
jgi:hypothetical protein